MASDQPLQDAENEKKTEAQQVEQGKQPLNLLPFYVQLQNVFAVEISAKRFPVSITTVVNTALQLNLMAINVDEETLQAEVILNVK